MFGQLAEYCYIVQQTSVQIMSQLHHDDAESCATVFLASWSLSGIGM
jgi:hypothetical protein